MACGGLGQRRQPRSARTFLQPRASEQGKAQAFRFNSGLGQKCLYMIGLGPAFGAQPMIRYQRQNAASARCHPISRQQREREAMRPA
jgi:hypothetical protein